MAEKKKTFEENLLRLEQIVSELEDDSLSLEKSLKLYEEGVKLAGKCSLELEGAERKIKMLQRTADGGITEETVVIEQEL
ncbi:MAG: exodeoxyribonuclease VII small subunit [Ruminococcaceae bacterium]|nr:exodeoxyribonuclease VII small subunit [Oscillospiraceae bacterium]